MFSQAASAESFPIGFGYFWFEWWNSGLDNGYTRLGGLTARVAAEPVICARSRAYPAVTRICL